MHLHPGFFATLRLMHGDELDVAEMMRDGDLASPQQIGNFALFKLRVSGVGVAYRPKHDEWVYRRPENYLTARFLQRCNGLPVIWEHPDGAVLTHGEWFKRSIGTVTLPFIEGDEVWAIARIYDKGAIKDMAKEQLSTSPSVVFRDPSVNMRLENIDGTSTLVEGPPSLIDHVAICRNGVWDKDNGPDGIAFEGAEVLSDEALDRMADSIDGVEDQMDILAIHQRLTRGPLSSMERIYGH